MAGGGKVCVTGAGGFVASWLVKVLLSRGYTVHGTVRDPGDPKNAHLKRFENAENLQLFKADLLDYGSLHAAIAGCEGVFHTASPCPSGKVPDPENELVIPARDGALNVLEACSASKVRRVVVVSSAAAVTLNPNWPHGKIKDESCWSDKEFCKATENWYYLSKTIAEEKALEYAKKSGLDVVTICPPLVIGPMLQSLVNASSLFLIQILKGERESMDIQFRSFVDVRDLADALILLYETPEASGRYICSSYSIKSPDFVDKLKSIYPNFKSPKFAIEVKPDAKLGSEKLQQLGWRYRTLEESIGDTIECFLKSGILNEK